MAGIECLKGLFIKQKSILDTEPNEPKLDRELNIRFSTRNRGSVRLSQGLFYTREEWERKRKELLSKPLP